MSRNKIDELFDKMNPRRGPDDIDSDEKKSRGEERFKSTLKIQSLDYYAILGVDKKASALEIKRAYQKLLKKNGPDRVEQTKENKIKYKLIREAGETLRDVHKRKAYDMERSMDKSTGDFVSQRDSFKEFIKLQEQSMTDEDRKIAKINFERSYDEMNKRHGYDPSIEKAIDKDEYKRRIDDALLQREQEDIEIEHDDVFNLEGGGSFDPNAFNRMFENKKKRDEKRKKKGGLVKYDEGIAAFNDDGDFGGTSVDNYGNLYGEGAFSGFGENFAGVGSGMMGQDDGRSDDEISIDSVDEYDYDSHNKGASKESLDAQMKKYMAERNAHDKQFENMTDVDFGSAMDDKYGISSQLGFMVGNSMQGHQRGRKKMNDKLMKETLKIIKELEHENKSQTASK